MLQFISVAPDLSGMVVSVLTQQVDTDTRQPTAAVRDSGHLAEARSLSDADTITDLESGCVPGVYMYHEGLFVIHISPLIIGDGTVIHVYRRSRLPIHDGGATT